MDYTAFDTHCHPQLPQYDEDRSGVITEALKRGIGMICVGTNVATSRQALALAERYEGLYASVGLHPNDNLNEIYAQGEYRQLASHPRVVAIGEIGLDYFRTVDSILKEKQRDRLSQQLALAREVGKPVILHCRNAHADMLDVLRNEQGLRGVVVHSFNGTIEQARAYLDGGCYIGLNGIMTFSREYIPMIKSLPLDRILLETDAPYLAPIPYRGQRNTPLYIEAVGNYLADTLAMDRESFFVQTTSNAKVLFGI